LNYQDQISASITELMKQDEKVLILGEGVADIKGIFGTTLEAHRRFPDRVIETPVSENMITGACAGLAEAGYKPILVHARAEFSLLGIEHMVNTIAKWPWLHNGQQLPIIFRLIVGRGWGQGPTHSQSFHHWFANVPGLQVMYPVSPESVRDAFGSAHHSGKPTIIFEPRRLYETQEGQFSAVGSKSHDIRVTCLTIGDVIVEACAASNALEKAGITMDVHPIEYMDGHTENILHSRARLIPLDSQAYVVAEASPATYGASAEVAFQLSQMIQSPGRIGRVTSPNIPLGTSQNFERAWYPSARDIVREVLRLTRINPDPYPDVVETVDNFRGPF
jgi:pyruvate/2-oxoglutarate/acetoin dehydrogenase E1 component